MNPPTLDARPANDAASAGASPAPAAPDPFALPAGPRDPASAGGEPGVVHIDAWMRARQVKGVPPAPASCPTRAGGTTSASDQDIASLIVRADEGSPACADVLVDPYIAKGATLAGRAGHALVGLSLAAKLARTASAPPKMTGPADKAKVLAFIKGPLRAWTLEQATAIETLGAGAAGLEGYGRGVAAIEAGSADLRLVDNIRSSPTPAGWDAELKSVYEAALDEALEPRKRRGRDAALVGLADFAALGARGDPRVDRARAILAKLYGGRRIDALDALALPPSPAPSSRAAQRWLDGKTAAGGGAEDRSAYARTRLDLGRTYWRRVDFVEAAYAAKASADPEDRLVLAVALALASGPPSAVDMMLATSPSQLHLDHTAALDALAANKSTVAIAGDAAFDAAHLRSLSPPDGSAAAAYWRDVAARFRAAAAQLDDPAKKKRAEDRAADADAAAAQAPPPAGGGQSM